MSTFIQKSTPKKYYPAAEVNVNDLCRVCDENFKIIGRGYHKIFSTEKSLNERLSTILTCEIKEQSQFSSYLCQGCFLKLNKFEKLLTQLDAYKKQYSDSVKKQREKRCSRDSPLVSPSTKQKIKRDCNVSPRNSPIRKTSARRCLPLGNNKSALVEQSIPLQTPTISSQPDITWPLLKHLPYLQNTELTSLFSPPNIALNSQKPVCSRQVYSRDMGNAGGVKENSKVEVILKFILLIRDRHFE